MMRSHSLVFFVCLIHTQLGATLAIDDGAKDFVTGYIFCITAFVVLGYLRIEYFVTLEPNDGLQQQS